MILVPKLLLPNLLCLQLTTSPFVNQISYGRMTTKGNTECEMDLFIMQADGKKIVDPSKQDALQSRLQIVLSRPLRVSLISRGPDTELLVANPVELSGKGRPLVFNDITLALKMLDTPIFSVLVAAHSSVSIICSFEIIFPNKLILSVSKLKSLPCHMISVCLSLTWLNICWFESDCSPVSLK